MAGAWWARMQTSSSSTSSTNSRGKTKGKRQRRRSNRSGPGKRPGRSLAQGCESQPDFLVNIILLIRRDVKRNLEPPLTFLWKSAGAAQGLDAWERAPHRTLTPKKVELEQSKHDGSWVSCCDCAIFPAGAGGLRQPEARFALAGHKESQNGRPTGLDLVVLGQEVVRFAATDLSSLCWPRRA